MPYLGQRLMKLGPQILSLGPWFCSVAVNHKYYLYGIAGLLFLAIYCSVALACVWCLWNEQRILEKIRFRVSAKGGVQQDNVEDFIADRFQQIRDDNRSIRDRVYFVENLRKQYPNPSKDHLHNLRMLGRETLPVRVKTAIEQAVDAGERSSARSRLHAEMVRYSLQAESRGLLERTSQINLATCNCANSLRVGGGLVTGLAGNFVSILAAID